MAGVKFISMGCGISTIDVGMEWGHVVSRIHMMQTESLSFTVICVGEYGCRATSSSGNHCILEFLSTFHGCGHLLFGIIDSPFSPASQVVLQCPEGTTSFLMLLCGQMC